MVSRAKSQAILVRSDSYEHTLNHHKKWRFSAIAQDGWIGYIARNMALAELKAACKQLADELNTPAIVSVHQALSNVPISAWPVVLEYVLLPLRVVVTHPKSTEKDVITAISTIGQLLSRLGSAGKVDDNVTYFGMMGLVLDGHGLHISLSDEIITATTTALIALQRHEGFAAALAQPTKLSSFGQVLYSALDVATTSNRSPKCRLASLSLVSKLVVLMAEQEVRVLAFSLPGILSNLGSVLMLHKQGASRLVVAALNVLSLISHYILCNERGPPEVSAAQQISALSLAAPQEGVPDTTATPSVENMKTDARSMLVDQTYGWWQQVEPQVMHVVSKVFSSLIRHPSDAVLRATATAAFIMAERCHKTLPGCLPVLLDTLVTCQSALVPATRSLAQAQLHVLQQHAPNRDWQHVMIQLAEERLLQLSLELKSLPDERLQEQLARLHAYLKLLGQQGTERLLADAQNANRFISILLRLLQLDVPAMAPALRMTVSDTVEATFGGLPLPVRRVYVCHTNDAVAEGVAAMTGLIASYLPVSSLFPQLFEQIVNVVDQPESVLLLQACLTPPTAEAIMDGALVQGLKQPMPEVWNFATGYKCKAVSNTLPTYSSRQVDLATELVRTLLDEDVWNFATKGREQSVQALNEPKTELAVRSSRSIVGSCLLLETVAECAKVIGPSFEGLIIDAMYFIMLHLGLPQARIAESAKYCLEAVASACHYETPADLITANSDYLINDATLRIRYMSVDPLAAYSIQQLLGYAAPALLLAVKDMMDDVFVALDGYQPANLTQFVLILNSMLHALSRWHQGDALPLDYHHYDHHGLRSEAGRPKLPTDVTNDDNPDPPPHITLVLETLSRAKHLLGDANPQHQVLLLDCIRLGMTLLGPFERQLLPCVAQLWPPTLACMQSDTPWVATAAIEVLAPMAQASGSFLRDRISREATPILLQKLSSQRNRLIDQSDYSARVAGPRHKMVISILQVLQAVWVHLQPSAQELQLVAASAAVYLHRDLESSIQNTSVELLTALIGLDADVVWFELCKHYPPQPLFDNLDQLSAKYQFEYTSQLPPADTNYSEQASKLYAVIATTDQA
eukprot:m.224326 g.224326  ORF g.224326 m.224326 type:complete len:1086 (+) comp17286_c0_seq3:465-3722(+)